MTLYSSRSQQVELFSIMNWRGFGDSAHRDSITKTNIVNLKIVANEKIFFDLIYTADIRRSLFVFHTKLKM